MRPFFGLLTRLLPRHGVLRRVLAALLGVVLLAGCAEPLAADVHDGDAGQAEVASAATAGMPAGAAFAGTGERSTDNIGLVGQYELTAGGLSLGGSVRYDDNNRFADVTTWRVQGGYRLATGTRFHAAYGTGVKNPGYYELYGYSDGQYIGNPDLKPEKSEGWEAGIDQIFANGRH